MVHWYCRIYMYVQLYFRDDTMDDRFPRSLITLYGLAK